MSGPKYSTHGEDDDVAKKEINRVELDGNREIGRPTKRWDGVKELDKKTSLSFQESRKVGRVKKKESYCVKGRGTMCYKYSSHWSMNCS